MEEEFSVNSKITAAEKINSLKNNFEIGGTIGCTIRFADPQDTSHYHRVDLLDQCTEDEYAAQGPNLLNYSDTHHTGKLVPIFVPPPIQCENCEDVVMSFYWSLFGAADPTMPTQQDFDNAKNKIAAYNVIIANIFPNPMLLGHVSVPADFNTRHNQAVTGFQLLPSGVTLPTGTTEADFLTYLDLAYSNGFAIHVKYTLDLFGFEVDPVDDVEKINTYGVKMISPRGEAFWGMFDFDELAVVPNY